MVSSNSVDKTSNEFCEYNDRCEKEATNHCQRCRQIFCMDHYLQHQRDIQEQFEYVLRTHGLLSQKLKSLISQLSADAIFDLIEQIYEFKIKSNEIKKTANIIEQQLQGLIIEDKQQSNERLITMTNESELDQNDHLENDIERLSEEIEKLKLKFEEINHYTQKRVSHEEIHTHDKNIQSDNLPETIKSPLSTLISPNKQSRPRSVDNTSENSVIQQANDNTVLSYLLLQQMSPSIIDRNENDLDLTETEDDRYLEEEDDMLGVIDSNTTRRASRKIRLSNNIVKYLRGPIRVMVDTTMHVAEGFAQEVHASDAVKKAVEQGLARQKRNEIEQQTAKRSFKPAFAEITSDWKFEGENPDRGFTSPSIWMRDPQGRRILVKTQDLSLCAANEWLAYALGRLLGLPVNEVQIAIYQDKLVTLHTDVTQENEKIITFMDLPKQMRNKLLTDPILESMDLFDHIIQNVDRNPRNILITMPNTTTIDDNTAKLKVFLIDHSSCFGMGKLNGISVVASKLHSQHLSVVKFNPVEQARKFDRYLSKLPGEDRILIKNTLNRFAAITDKQIDSWVTEIQDLLSSSQYNRIHSVLYRQRDIVRRYTIQWGIYPRSPSVKSNETSQLAFAMNNSVTYF
jgi:hypothetical protein